MNPPGLGFRGTKLYTWDTVTRRLQELDPSSGATLNTLDIGIASPGVGGDLTFRGDGIGFLTNPATSFFRFDVTVPNSSPITGSLNPGMSGLAFNSSGVLYGLNSVSGDLYTVDTVSGSTALVGSTGFPSLTGNSLAFDPSGRLYAVAGADLYEINPATAAATLIGPIGQSRHLGHCLPAPGRRDRDPVRRRHGRDRGWSTDTYTVALHTAPTANVTITMNPGDAG